MTSLVLNNRALTVESIGLFWYHYRSVAGMVLLEYK